MSRWDPFDDLLSLREAMNQLLESSYVRPRTGTMQTSQQGVRSLALDMYETENDIVVKATLPGVKPEDININVTGNVLTISGQVRSEQKDEKQNYHHRERYFGQFFRQVTLPDGVQGDKADASYENGVLTLTLPKAESAKPRQIKVRSGGTPAQNLRIEGQATPANEQLSNTNSDAAQTNQQQGTTSNQ
jgi:HSP20 family protein